MSKVASGKLIKLAAQMARCDGMPDITPDEALSVAKDWAVTLRHTIDMYVRPMERDRADLLKCVRGTERWADYQGAWEMRDLLRAAIAKATGASHE